MLPAARASPSCSRLFALRVCAGALAHLHRAYSSHTHTICCLTHSHTRDWMPCAGPGLGRLRSRCHGRVHLGPQQRLSGRPAAPAQPVGTPAQRSARCLLAGLLGLRPLRGSPLKHATLLYCNKRAEEELQSPWMAGTLPYSCPPGLQDTLPLHAWGTASPIPDADIVFRRRGVTDVYPLPVLMRQGQTRPRPAQVGCAWSQPPQACGQLWAQRMLMQPPGSTA